MCLAAPIGQVSAALSVSLTPLHSCPALRQASENKQLDSVARTNGRALHQRPAESRKRNLLRLRRIGSRATAAATVAVASAKAPTTT